MKAQTRPLSVLPYVLCCVICLVAVSAPLTPGSLAYAKTRPEVQLGDPTDTDPGPTPSTAAKAAGIQRVWEPSANRLDGSTRRLFGIWLRIILFKYGPLGP